MEESLGADWLPLAISDCRDNSRKQARRDEMQGTHVNGWLLHVLCLFIHQGTSEFQDLDLIQDPLFGALI